MTIINQMTLRLLITFLALCWGAAFAEDEPLITPDSAVCARCSVYRNNNSLQPVRAESDYKGKVYYFCSKECKAQFDNNPDHYIVWPLPRPAPQFTLTNLVGSLDSLSRYRGKLVLVDFWATWCTPCVKSMQDLEAMHRQYATDSLVILGVTLDTLGNAKVADYASKHRITYPILYDSRSQPTWLSFGAKSIPSLYLVDRDGNIVRQWRGATDKNEIMTAVRKLLSQSTAK